jgi:hypothetical protein
VPKKRISGPPDAEQLQPVAAYHEMTAVTFFVLTPAWLQSIYLQVQIYHHPLFWILFERDFLLHRYFRPRDK